MNKPSKQWLCVFGGRGRGLCVFGELCVDMWRLVHQWSFQLFWLSFDCFWRLVHCWLSKTVQQKWLLVYQSSQVYQDCTNSVATVYQLSKTVKQQKMTIRVPTVTCLHRVCRIHEVRVRVRRIHKTQTIRLNMQSHYLSVCCKCFFLNVNNKQMWLPNKVTNNVTNTDDQRNTPPGWSLR